MRTKVREISSKGQSTLVEWDDEAGHLQRAYVPSSLLAWENGVPYVEDPQEGAPPGEDWELLISPPNPAQVASYLHQYGIWTYADFVSNTPAVNNAFREACAESYTKFVQAVHARQSGAVEERKE